MTQSHCILTLPWPWPNTSLNNTVTAVISRKIFERQHEFKTEICYEFALDPTNTCCNQKTSFEKLGLIQKPTKIKQLAKNIGTIILLPQ